MIGFKRYSKKYDMLLKYSKPYQDIGSRIILDLKLKFTKYQAFSFVDVGGGTGNFSKIILDQFPNATGLLLEPSQDMLALAKNKLGRNRMKYLGIPFEKYNGTSKYDVVICVHALYLMEDSRSKVPYFKRLMKNTSTLLICDIGQKIDVAEWTRHLFFKNMNRYGVAKAIKILWQAKEIKDANRTIEKKQMDGSIWRHSLSELVEIFRSDYKVHYGFTCYRGCSNFICCSLL